MLLIKFKYENKQRAITQKLNKQKSRFIGTALPLDEIHPPTKFHNYDMLQRKFKYENKQRTISQKLSKQELSIMGTAHPLGEIYPPSKFHNHS